MLPKLITSFSICLFAGIQTMFAQASRVENIRVDTTLKDTFSFTDQWAYAPYIEKDDNGRFSSGYTGKITATDTAHLFFTANCETNVQGGYVVRYCYTSKKGKTIKLNFTSDGAGDYGGDFCVYITGDSFYFKPWVDYPVTSGGEKLAFTVDKEKLVLNKPGYAIGDTVIGYIDCTFTETCLIPGKKTHKNKLWLKGYFCTPLKEKEEPRK